MSLITIWSLFIFLISYFEEFYQYQYLLSSGFMFCLTYFCNQIGFINVPLRVTILLFNIPTIILWYIAYVYNDFLAIHPMSSDLFMTLLLIYIYLTLYILLTPELLSIYTANLVIKAIFKFYCCKYLVVSDNWFEKKPYQLDFRIPLISPNLTNFRNTVREKAVNL